jgi:hypothetical protein
MRRTATTLTLVLLASVFAFCVGCQKSGDDKAAPADAAPEVPAAKDAGG